MDKYICQPHDLPHFLYRVQYPESRTAYSELEGLQAADTTDATQSYNLWDSDLDCFKAEVEYHFTWSYRGESPFISLFSDKTHAKNWACKEPWRSYKPPKKEWSLLTIDTSLLPDKTYVWRLRTLVNSDLGVEIPEGAKSHEERGFFCLREVPACAIVSKTPGRNVEALQGYFPRTYPIQPTVRHIVFSDSTDEEESDSESSSVDEQKSSSDLASLINATRDLSIDGTTTKDTN